MATSSKKSRLFAALLAVLFVLSASVSAAFLVKEANHRCTNHTDCQICHTMQLCLNNLSNPGTVSSAAGSAQALRFFGLLAAAVLLAGAKSETLVSLKIKLSD